MATIKTTTPLREPPLKPAVVSMWREQMGYSLRDAEKELGCTRKTIIAWEKGRSEIPRAIGLAMAALAMGMRPYGSKPLREAK